MLNTLRIKDNKTNESEPGKASDRMVSDYFGTREPGLVKMIHFPERKRRTRLVVKKGTENISMLLENIVLFYTENKVVFAIDQAGKKYIADGNLSSLQNELDDNIFFRATRKYIININHVKSFSVYEKVKLKVNMNPNELNVQYYIIISQETAPSFRKWIYTA